MRGKLRCTCLCFVVIRITPADAGKTRMAELYDREQEDHPRGCGENSEPAGKTIVNAGSPPRMRGKLSFQQIPLSLNGITPADAGKTL